MALDGTFIAYIGISLLLGAALSLYTLVVVFTPPPIVTHPKEEKYRSRNSPKNPLPLTSVHDPAQVDLSVVVPAFNETQRLPSMLDTTLNHLRTQKWTYEILIVDDGSTDDTSSLSLKLAAANPDADIRVITFVQNRGKGGAVRHGMLYSRGKRLLMVDADGASRFEDINQLWDAMDKMEDKAVVVGSRAHLVKTEAVVKRSLLRNILMYGFHTILRVLGVGHIRDTQCGFKLFSRSAAQSIFPAQHLSTWIFDVELLVLAQKLGIEVKEVNVEWHEIAGSKLNVISASLQMLRDLIVMRTNYALGRWKVKVN